MLCSSKYCKLKSRCFFVLHFMIRIRKVISELLCCLSVIAALTLLWVKRTVTGKRLWTWLWKLYDNASKMPAFWRNPNVSGSFEKLNRIHFGSCSVPVFLCLSFSLLATANLGSGFWLCMVFRQCVSNAMIEPGLTYELQAYGNVRKELN